MKTRQFDKVSKVSLLCVATLLLFSLVACVNPAQSDATDVASKEIIPDNAQQGSISADDENLENSSSGSTEGDHPSSGTSSDAAENSQSQDEHDNGTPPKNSHFEIHFIDVGQADAALILCDNTAMLIDGGNVADSSLIYAYLQEHNVGHLDYIVCTHAHEDHVGGLAGALNYATTDVAFCSVSQYDSKAFADFQKYLEKQDVAITIPKAGGTFALGSAEIEIIGPINPSNDTNNSSIVLRIVYGQTSFLFTGDAEREEEQDILDAGYVLSSTVLKVGHHGSANSTTYPFLREIMPAYAVISVGSNNSYGHPTDEALSRLRDAEVTVYRTDIQGHIICRSDGEDVEFSVTRNAEAETIGLPSNSVEKGGAASSAPGENGENTGHGDGSGTGANYILNTNTHKFHYPSCSSINSMKESNKSSYTGTRDEIISMGYSPCGRCNP